MEQLRLVMDSEVIQSLGWTLLHSIWQMGVLAILVFVISRLLPGKNAVGKYWLATAGLFTGVAWSLTTFATRYLTSTAEVAPGISDPIAMLSTVLGVGNAELGFADRFNQFITANIPLFVTVWVLGLVLFSLRLAGGWLYLSKLRGSAIKVSDADVLKMVKEISAKLKLGKKVVLSESAEVLAPVLVGVFKPIILFPVAYISQLSTEETEAVLAHELAHVKRHDYWINIMQSVVESFFFFNPFMWWLSEKMREEREHCCDDMAVRITGRPKVYAETLATVQEIKITRLAVGFNGRKGKLLTRVKRLFEPGKRSNLDRSITALLLVALVSGIYWQAREINLQDLELPMSTASLDLSDQFESQQEFILASDTVPAVQPPPPSNFEQPPPPRQEDQQNTIVEIIDVPDENYFEVIIEEAPDAMLHDSSPIVMNSLSSQNIYGSGRIRSAIGTSMQDLSSAINQWISSSSDTVPPNMEQIKGMIQQQMNMMKQQQLLMEAEMLKMQQQMKMMQSELQMNALKESLEMVENLTEEELKQQFKEQKILTEEHMRELRELEKRAQMDMERAIVELEKSRARHEQEIKKIKEFEMQQFEVQRDMMEEQMQEARQKVAALEKAYKEYHTALVKELVKDGYLKSDEDNLNINVNDGVMTVNGKKVKSKDKQKYDKLKDKYMKDYQ